MLMDVGLLRCCLVVAIATMVSQTESFGLLHPFPHLWRWTSARSANQFTPYGALSPVPPWLKWKHSSEEDKDVDASPIIVEGDIAVDPEETLFRLGIRWDRYPRKRWANNTIPYVISNEYRPREYRLIESALKTFQLLSCLKFVPYDGTQEDYLHIHHSKKRPGCWSYIGRRGGRQELSLRPPEYDDNEEYDNMKNNCHCLCDVGRVLHETMHALGFYHEHSRPDRDHHIKIVQENVKSGKIRNFNKLKVNRAVFNEFDYDYDSIMHYGPYYFSKNPDAPLQTIVPLRPGGAQIGQRAMLSKLDCMKLNQQFGCFDRRNQWQNHKIQVLCGLMGFSYEKQNF